MLPAATASASRQFPGMNILRDVSSFSFGFPRRSSSFFSRCIRSCSRVALTTSPLTAATNTHSHEVLRTCVSPCARLRANECACERPRDATRIHAHTRTHTFVSAAVHSWLIRVVLGLYSRLHRLRRRHRVPRGPLIMHSPALGGLGPCCCGNCTASPIGPFCLVNNCSLSGPCLWCVIFGLESHRS